MTMSEDNNSCAISEVILLSGACVMMIVLVIILYINMDENWASDPETRTRVLIFAMVVFFFNILLCCYMSKKLGVRICRPQVYEDERRDFYSVNSSRHLLSQDLPPSYDSITVTCTSNIINPPTYDEVNIKSIVLNPVKVHHKATG
ncbi:uncharacterized protein LOC142325368 isoform X2 [Lycorma delicatula]|uniref:uncharacterized protein LOC142325368 isoform X2 n=1 Tax=Lycorma delicatula TaxID=130591 RepID=UPI003F50FCCB